MDEKSSGLTIHFNYDILNLKGGMTHGKACDRFE